MRFAYFFVTLQWTFLLASAIIDKKTYDKNDCFLGDGLRGKCKVLQLKIENQKFSSVDLSDSINTQDNAGRTDIFQIYVDNFSIDIGTEIDSFLARRPWWHLQEEPYSWISPPKSNLTVQFILVSSPWDQYLRMRSQIQFPNDCESELIFSFTHGFADWNNHMVQCLKNAKLNADALFTPYMLDTNSRTFYDKPHCENHNKFTCEYLPVTNCVLNISNQLREGCSLHMPTAQSNKGEKPPRKYQQFNERIYLTTYSNLQNTSTSPLIEPLESSEEVMLIYSFFFRLNYQYRSKVAHHIHNWWQKYYSSMTFPTNGDCVAVHIHVTQKPRRHILQDYLTAASIVNNKTNNILIVTNTIQAVRTEVLKVFSNSSVKNIFIMPLVRQTGKVSVDSAVSFLSALHVIQECSGLVSSSVDDREIFDILIKYLCVRHGSIRFGSCPKVFDFK